MPGRTRRIVARATGRVQGVGYRAFCTHEATRMGITGYAKNLPDGRVEAWVEGESDAVTRVDANGGTPSRKDAQLFGMSEEQASSEGTRRDAYRKLREDYLRQADEFFGVPFGLVVAGTGVGARAEGGHVDPALDGFGDEGGGAMSGNCSYS